MRIINDNDSKRLKYMRLKISNNSFFSLTVIFDRRGGCVPPKADRKMCHCFVGKQQKKERHLLQDNVFNGF